MVDLLVREPVLIPCGGDSPKAAEAYRITASVLVMPVLEVGVALEVEAAGDQVEISCGHVLACFHTPEYRRYETILRSGGQPAVLSAYGRGPE